MTLSRTANRERREAFRQGRDLPPTWTRYRLARAVDPYMNASRALWATRQDRAGEAAGIPLWPDCLTDEPVMIDGREYAVTTEPDQDAYPPADMGDCYGEIREPSASRIEANWYNPLPVEWPEVRPAGQTWSYYPGDTWDPPTPYHRGMARGPAREYVRGQLLEEAHRYRQNQTGDVPMFYVVALRDVAEDSTTYLGGVDGLTDAVHGRGYLWDVVQDMAAELAAGAAQKRQEARNALCAATAHG